jgi:hypothetical protein
VGQRVDTSAAKAFGQNPTLHSVQRYAQAIGAELSISLVVHV